MKGEKVSGRGVDDEYFSIELYPSCSTLGMRIASSFLVLVESDGVPMSVVTDPTRPRIKPMLVCYGPYSWRCSQGCV